MASQYKAPFPYHASSVAAYLFTILYSLLFFWHLLILALRLGTPRSPISRRPSTSFRHTYYTLLVIGAAIEVVGYGLRSASIKSTNSNNHLYAISTGLIVIAPIFVCASLYLLIARLVRWTIPKDGNVKKAQHVLGVGPRWLARGFITSDVSSFCLQGAGSGIALSGSRGKTDRANQAGLDVVIVGLALQLTTFAFFLFVVVAFRRRISHVKQGLSQDKRLDGVLVGVYVAGACIWIRSLYRLIEFALGFHGYPWQHEWPLYALEATPMFIVFVVTAWFHPARWLDVNSGRLAGSGEFGMVERRYPSEY